MFDTISDNNTENTDNKLILTKTERKFKSFEDFGVHIISTGAIGKIMEYLNTNGIKDFDYLKCLNLEL